MELPLQKGDCDVAGIAKCVICILIRDFACIMIIANTLRMP